MEDKRLKEILKRKESIESEIKALKLEIASLKKTKEKNTEESNEMTFARGEDIKEDKQIEEKKQRIKKLEDAKKEIAIKIRTIKGSITKINNKRPVIEQLNSEIKDVNAEINSIHSEKLKSLRNLQREKLPKLKNLKKKIIAYEDLAKLYKDDKAQIKEIALKIETIKEEYNKLEEEIAHEFEQICIKYDTLKKEKIVLLSKKVEELKKVNKSCMSLKSSIENNFNMIENLIKDFQIEFSSEAKDVKIDKNSANTAGAICGKQPKIDEELDVEEICETGTLQEDLPETKEEIKENLQADIEEIEDSMVVPTENIVEESMSPVEELMQTINEEEMSQKVKIVKEEIPKEEQDEELLAQEVIKKINEHEMPQKFKVADDKEFEQFERFEEDGDNYYSDYGSGPIYAQAYADMIRRNGPMGNININAEAPSTKSVNKKDKRLIRTMIIKESNSNNPESKYIEINGKRFVSSRKLDEETAQEVEYMCIRCLNLSSDMSWREKHKLQKLKQKVDPAVINAIKARLDSKLSELKNEILKCKKNEELSGSDIEEIERIERKYMYEYERYINEYIMFLDEENLDRLSFDLIYDCSERLNVNRYFEIYHYINSAEKSGITVKGKQSIFEAFQNVFKPVEEPEISRVPRHTEGDKSFVPKVNVTAGASRFFSGITRKVNVTEKEKN